MEEGIPPTRATPRAAGGWLRLALWYGGSLLVAALVFGLIRGWGEGLGEAAGTVPGVREGKGMGILTRVLLALVAIIVVGRVLGALLVKIRQPPVIGEVLAGILLGPSLLGMEFSAQILPPAAAPYLGILAQVGIVLYMFLVGLEFDPAHLRGRAQAAIAISHAGIVFPFLLGCGLALPMYPTLAPAGVGFTGFALFMGVAMAITAFPVLARILADHGLSRSRLGTMALGCAAVDDVTAWCVLALVVGVVKAQMGHGLMVVGGALGFILGMVLLGRPVLRGLARRWQGEQGGWAGAGLVVAMLLSAVVAEWIGIHALFGAFLAGVMIPHESVAAVSMRRQMEQLVAVVLLPAFFAYAGMRTRIDLLDDPVHWLWFALILAVAVLGKFGGTWVAARFAGLDGRSAAALGALMNTRGLMELIVLSVGLDLGVISPELYSMMVLMALATTALTSPWLHLLKRGGRLDS